MIESVELPHLELETSGSTLDQNRIDAVQKLTAYLETPDEKVLREHQVDVMQDLKDAFERGENAGYIHLPAGSGKTVIATELSRVLGKKTLIVSPTRLILGQTHDKASKFSPDLKISNYYSEEKDLSGDVINTTYSSLQELLASGKIDPKEIELLIADEAHAALGPQRHTIFKEFSNALLLGLTATPEFSILDFFERVGKVEKDERWLKLFRNKIHETTKEEAIERGVLSPTDIYLFKTLSSVGDVSISGTGQYSEVEISRYLNREIRNNMAIGMICGMEKVASPVAIDDKTREEIELLHHTINGKRTVVFGLNIEHVEDLAEKLNAIGVVAAAVHGKMSVTKREEILERHTRGEIQVVLGVDLLRLGWDSPETEVGIFLSPTQSTVVLEQELGRIMRPSPTSGKDRAIAIQLVDTFRHRAQEPLLLPNLFDPYFVTKGRARFPRDSQNGSHGGKDNPKLTFSGMNMNSILENYSSQNLLQKRFKGASIDEIDDYINEELTKISEEYPNDLFGLYQKLADEMPSKAPQEVAEKTLQAVASIDSNIAKKGARILAFVYINSILSGVDAYITADRDKNADIVQHAVAAVMENAKSLSHRYGVAQQVYHAAHNSASELVASEMHLPSNFIRNTQAYKIIQDTIDEEFIIGKRIISDKELDEIAERVSTATKIPQDTLHDYFKFINMIKPLEPSDAVADINADTEEIINNIELREITEDKLAILNSTDRKIVKLRHGLIDGKKYTEEEVAREFGVTRPRIRQRVEMALRILRKRSITKFLRPFVEGDQQRPIKVSPDYADWVVGSSYWRSLSSDYYKSLTPAEKTQREIDRQIW